MTISAKHQKFKDLLESEHQWPGEYMFKFIVPKNQEAEVSALFPNHELSVRPSSGGKYLSVTAQIEIESADVVIAIYEKASLIPGLIAL